MIKADSPWCVARYTHPDFWEHVHGQQPNAAIAVL